MSPLKLGQFNNIKDKNFHKKLSLLISEDTLDKDSYNCSVTILYICFSIDIF